MRYAALLLLVPAVSLAQGNEGEKLFRQMEEKLLKAKALKAAVEADFKGEGKEGKLKATARLAEGNKARLELNMDFGGKDISMTLVSDGASAQMAMLGKSKEVPVPKNLDRLLRMAAARAGLFGVTTMAFRPKKDGDLDPDKLLRISDFKAEAGEKVNGRDTKVVKYKLDIEGEPKSAQVTLWIDAKTLLPVKRTIRPEGEGMVTENYTEMAVDAKIDPKTFELTK